MRQFSEEMEWNSKWDWESFGVYGSKAIESPKKADWGIIDDGGSLNGSSAKSSISASTDSSTKDGMRTMEGSGSGSFSKGTGFSTTCSPPPMDSSSLLGLKLGKRTYFENIGGGGVKLCEMPTPSTITVKKTKPSGQNGPPICCQVEGCNIDLSKAKEYHRKHRVCESHSKCPKVVVGGRERRFCQQCSRFHSVSEFDEKKRSCRRRLSDHNARRRKPQQETIQFDPTRHAASYYGGNQEMSFVFNNSSPLRTPGNCGWDDGACNSKFTLTQGYSFKSNGDAGATEQQLHIRAPQGTINMQNTAANALKNSTTPLVSNPGTKGSLISSLSAAAPEFGRALSLLSSNSWDSCEPESIPLHHQMHKSDIQPMIHANPIPEGVPLSSSDFWLTGQQHSIHPHVPTNANFQEIRLSKTPYDPNFFSNILN